MIAIAATTDASTTRERIMKCMTCVTAAVVMLGAGPTLARAQVASVATTAAQPIVLHAARLFEVVPGRIVSPGEVLVENGRIQAAGTSVPHPAGAKVIDLGDVTLMPGLIDAHVHLFLHPAPPSEGMQTVYESAPQRTIEATLAARADLMAGFTSERDMVGTDSAFFPAQKLSREQALQTYTTNGAYVEFHEHKMGSLTPGKWADITVLSRNIMTAPADSILGTKALYTIVGGKVVYSADKSQ